MILVLHMVYWMHHASLWINEAEWSDGSRFELLISWTLRQAMFLACGFLRTQMVIGERTTDKSIRSHLLRCEGSGAPP